jgi:hemerythrin
MREPTIMLGIPLMDRDHAVLEDMLARTSATDDAGLKALLIEIEQETRAHFEREEALMRDQSVPVLSCHMVQHAMLLGHFMQAHAAIASNDNQALRTFLADVLPALLDRHVNTADRVTAGLLGNVLTPALKY